MYMHLTDAHCHANFSMFADGDGLAVGLRACVDACFSGDWEGLRAFDAFEIKKAYGLHPDLRISEFDNIEFVEREVFERFLPEVQQYLISADAIGETGLDARISERVPMDLQRKVFAAQLKLADKFRLPVIVHCVGAWGGALDEHLKWRQSGDNITESQRLRGEKEKRFLIHAARCSAEMVREFEKIGGYFSFGLRELSSEKGTLCAAAVPVDRLMVESDGVSSREKISETIEVLAKIKEVDPIELSEKIYLNFNNFYGK